MILELLLNQSRHWQTWQQGPLKSLQGLAVANEVLTEEVPVLEVFLCPAVALWLRLLVTKLTRTRLSSASEEPSVQRQLSTYS